MALFKYTFHYSTWLWADNSFPSPERMRTFLFKVYSTEQVWGKRRQRSRWLWMQVQNIYLSDIFELGIRRGVIELFLWCCSILLSIDKKTWAFFSLPNGTLQLDLLEAKGTTLCFSNSILYEPHSISALCIEQPVAPDKQRNVAFLKFHKLYNKLI